MTIRKKFSLVSIELAHQLGKRYTPKKRAMMERIHEAHEFLLSHADDYIEYMKARRQ